MIMIKNMKYDSYNRNAETQAKFILFFDITLRNTHFPSRA